MAASYFGHLDVVQALLAKKADVNAKNNDGSALMWCRRCRQGGRGF
jgi:ankyrin repeat protein